MRRLMISLLALVALAGCKADMVQVRLSADDLAEALSGDLVEVTFEANFRSFGELDAEKREDVKHLREIAERYMEIEDFEMNNDGSVTTIEIEGTLPLVAATSMADADFAYGLVIEAVEDADLAAFPYRLSMVTGDRYAAMQKEMKGVNFMSAIDAVNPVQFRIRANGDGDLKLLAGGFSLDGETHGVSVVSIPNGDSASLTFKGGAYDDVGGSLLFSQP